MKYMTVMNVGLESCILEVQKKFDEMVNEAIQEGWKPLGGVSVVNGIKTEYENYGDKTAICFSISMRKRF